MAFTGRSGFPKTKISEIVLKDGSDYDTLSVLVTFTGKISFYVSSDNGTTWDKVTSITTNVWSNVTLTTAGTEVKWKTLMGPSSEISLIKIKRGE